MKLKSLPIKGMDLKKIKGNSAFGYRIHPVYKVKAMHYGIDYAGPLKTEIYSVDDGKIYISKKQDNGKGYGEYVIIKHNGYYSLYAHLYKRNVVTGQNVKAGQLIGYMGSTGDSTGSHLHLGICIDYTKYDKQWQDPLKLLNEIGTEDDEVITKIKIKINGEVKEVEAINKDDFNFIKLRDLEEAIDVEYDATLKMPVINSK